jgi:hypothetical protein
VTDDLTKKPRKVATITHIALGVSVLVSAGMWAVFLFPTNEGCFYFLTSWLLPWIFPLGITVAIVLDIIAGSRGGLNRVICIVAGLILLSPGASFAIYSVVDLIWPPS